MGKEIDPGAASAPSGVMTKTVQSSAWIYGRHFVTNIFNLGAMAILARQLDPRDFGLVALAQVLLRFVALLGASGIGDYVIFDREEGREGRVHAAFWLGLSFACLTGLIGIALVPLLVRFYGEPALQAVLLVLIAKHVLDQLYVVPDALIKRTLDYRKLVARDTVLEISSAAASVWMALRGWGVWSLVLPALFVSPIRVAAVLWMARWLPRLPFRRSEWPRIWRYSANAIGANLATSILAEGDTLVVGKALGSEALGIYNFAWQTANLVSRNVSGAVGKVAMPALAAVGGKMERLRLAFHRMLRLLATISFPMLVGLFVVAEEFVLTVYGPKWTDAVLPLRILILFAMRHCIGAPANSLCLVVGRPDIGFKVGAAVVPLYLLSIWIGSKYGVVGVAAGVTLSRTLGGIFAFWVSARLLGEGMGPVLRQLAQPFAAACLMGGIVAVVRLSLQRFGLPVPFLLVLLTCTGFAAYVVLLSTRYRGLQGELRAVWRALFSRRVTAPGVTS
jgi:PST family polysaccharide transporter